MTVYYPFGREDCDICPPDPFSKSWLALPMAGADHQSRFRQNCVPYTVLCMHGLLLTYYPRFYVTRSHIPFSGGTALYVTRSHIPFSGGTALCVTRSHIPFSWGYRVKVEEEEEEVRQGRGRGGGGRCVVIWPLPARYRSFETQQRTRAK